MKQIIIALPLLLWACGSKGSEITLSVTGVAIADLEGIRGELSGVKGVSNVRAGQLKEGQATIIASVKGVACHQASARDGLGFPSFTIVVSRQVTLRRTRSIFGPCTRSHP